MPFLAYFLARFSEPSSYAGLGWRSSACISPTR
jgi:hypothetical protein